jgi:succinoglycan biosynthesis transport protein ExoP
MTDANLKNSELRYQLVAEAAVEDPAESPLRLLRRALRGRWAVALVAASTLAVLGGLTGYHATQPLYQSTGLVRVEGELPAILYESLENEIPPMFDAYIASQVTYLQSWPVLDAAANMPRMREAGWPAAPHHVAELQKALTVRRGRGEQVISVSVSHSDPRLAQTAVNAVLAAYRQNSTDPGGLSRTEKERALVQREQLLEAELLQLRQEVLEASDQYGKAAIERMHTNKVAELMAIDQKLNEIGLTRARLHAGETVDGLDVEIPADPAVEDSALARLKEEELALLAELKSLQPRYGPNHPMVRDVNRRLDAVRIEMDLRSAPINRVDGGPGDDAAGRPALAQDTADRLNQIERYYRTIRGQVVEEASRLGSQQAALTGLTDQISETKERLSATRRRLDELRVEANRENLNRIRIAAFGDLPVAPILDRRRGLAAAGALFGFIIGASIVFFAGLSDRRVRFIDELETLLESEPVVGVLPDLDHTDRDGEQRAARNVHQLRNLLELQCADPASNVITLTSCDRGEGKTSLTMALGASFAAAGRKTLMIDADVVGRGLSRELSLEHVPGLCEAIGPGHAGGQVHHARQENLWAMPTGSARGLDPEDLSRQKLLWLLDALRSRFDAIIIDTGPVLSSIEAALVAAVSDRVIMLIRRNQDMRVVRASLAQLTQAGARHAGVVFNRASESDLNRREVASYGRPSIAATLVPPMLRADSGPVGAIGRVAPQDEEESTRKQAA